MTIRHIAVLCFSVFSTFLFAQKPACPTISSGLLIPVVHERGTSVACDADAGTVAVQLVKGAKSTSPSILCFGDKLWVKHAGGDAKKGDPQPATAPGFAYGFYKCKPTTAGTDLATIKADPCQFTTPPPNAGALIWQIPADSIGGNTLFVNDGTLQNTFNKGAPYKFFFAPMTVDEYKAGGVGSYESVAVGSPTGPCVAVNTGAAFSVVYLNAITTTGLESKGCTGTFKVFGGYPEYKTDTSYTIKIEKVGNVAIKGSAISPAGAPKHGSVVNFFVPEAGDYDITISDNKGSEKKFTVNMGTCVTVPLSVDMSEYTVQKGDTVCVDVSVTNFKDMRGVQYMLKWDPKIVQYIDVKLKKVLNPDLVPGGTISFDDKGGFSIVSWTNSVLSGPGLTLPANSVIYTMCFKAIGNAGTNSPLTLSTVDSDLEVTIVDTYTDRRVTGKSAVAGKAGKINISDFGAKPIIVGDKCGTKQGSISITPSGGTAPYTVTWVGADPANVAVTGTTTVAAVGGVANITGLIKGNYSVKISDSSSPAKVISQTSVVAGVDELIVSFKTPTDPTCFGDKNGEIEIKTATGGTPITTLSPVPYQIKWSTTDVNVSKISKLAAGTYSVTITDKNGCTSDAKTNIGVNKLVITPTVVDASCSGKADGSISVVATGGTPNVSSYKYQWTAPPAIEAPNTSRTNIKNGKYYLTVTDKNGCFVKDSIFVKAKKTLAITPTVTNVRCNGGNNASIVVVPTTIGAPASLPYIYTWSPNAASTIATADKLRAGTYTFKLTDADNCNLDTSFILVQPNKIEITLRANSKKDETCSPGSDGAAAVDVKGGTPTYSYAWSGTPSSTDAISKVKKGTYKVSVTDKNGCLDSLRIDISSPKSPTIARFDTTGVKCATATNGAIIVTALPGENTALTYKWSNTTQTTASISNVKPGEKITVTVTDGKNCSVSDTIRLYKPKSVALIDTTLKIPSCPKDKNGQIILGLAGGKAPYKITWTANPAGTTNLVITDLAAGKYIFSVTDANNCPPLTLPITLPSPPAVTMSFANITAVRCNGGSPCDGAVTAQAKGGSNPSQLFTFSWESGERGINPTKLCQGNQKVTVSDGLCNAMDSVLIPSPARLMVDSSLSKEIQPRCFNESNGSVTITAKGGTAPYTYGWDSGVTGETINNVRAVVHIVTITDSQQCSFIHTLKLKEPDILQAVIDQANTVGVVSCAKGADGKVAVQTNGGNKGVLTYTWSANSSAGNTGVADKLKPGDYFVTVSDVKGCADTVTYTISQPTQVFALVQEPKEPACYGYQTVVKIDTAYGGSGGKYTFSVDNGPRQQIDVPVNALAGDHKVTIFDANFCRFDTTVFIKQPPKIQVSIPRNKGDVIEIDLGDSTTVLRPNISLGSQIAIDSTVWTATGDSKKLLSYLSCTRCETPTIKPLDEGYYIFTVTNKNGCSGSDKVLIELNKNRNVYIPNVFTPNGDGLNDKVQIFTGAGVTKINRLQIFDRWGELLYEVKDVPSSAAGTVGWDGLFKGKTMPAGVYVYIAEVAFLDNIALLYRGDVTLIP
jgi:gliding motility-associated-like protein